MKRPLYIIASFILFLTAMSCQEQDEVAEFDNWQQQNERYLDSLATVARKGNGWTMYKSFNLGDPLDLNANIRSSRTERAPNTRSTTTPCVSTTSVISYRQHLILTDIVLTSPSRAMCSTSRPTCPLSSESTALSKASLRP